MNITNRLARHLHILLLSGFLFLPSAVVYFTLRVPCAAPPSLCPILYRAEAWKFTPMALTYTKFYSFVEALAEKVHNLGSDTLKIALTNSAPSASNTQLSNITEISYTNLSSRVVTVTGSAQTAGVYKLTLADLILTASGGAVGPFRYIVLYNDTATNDELISYWDYGSALTLNDGDSLELNFDDTNGVLQIQ